MAIPAMVIHLTGGRSGRGDRVIALAGYQGHGQRQDEEDHGQQMKGGGAVCGVHDAEDVIRR
jgi:hypothetical protein